MAPIQEGGAKSSTDVAEAEPLPNAAEAGRISQEAVPIEQGQPMRAVEPDEWALKVKAKPIPETPTQRQRDIHELTHLLPIIWYSTCVSGIAADDPKMHKILVLDVASFDHCDISSEVGMFNKKLKFKVLGKSQEWISCGIGRAKRLHRTHGPIHL